MWFSFILASAFIFLLTVSVIVILHQEQNIEPQHKIRRLNCHLKNNIIFLPEKEWFLCLFIMCTTQATSGYINKFLLVCSETYENAMTFL